MTDHLNNKFVTKRLLEQRSYLIFIAQLVLSLLILFIVFWWGYLLWIQADRLRQLQSILHDTRPLSGVTHHVTHKMIIAESLFFIFAIFCTASFLYFLYWRDLLRTKAIRAFFAGVTHELRTPLTSIRLQAESLSDPNVSSEFKNNLIKRLLADTSRLESELEKTLELARIEGGGPLYTQSYNLNSLIKTSIEDLKTRFTKDPQINIALDPQPTVIANPKAVQIILGNLVENSIRHGGKSHVIINISCKQKNNYISVLYSDNGFGVLENDYLLGTLFFKGQSSQGAGVGLYLVKALMQRMGGDALFAGQPTFQAELLFKKDDS